MRGFAKKNGFRLNQHGLYKPGKLLPSVTEKDIFLHLGMKYVEPKNRI
jgi:DNA polymerase/3'-5' exonuclease PolX